MKEHPLRNIEAIFFDFGGTLYEVSPVAIRIWQRLLEEWGLGSISLEDYYKALTKARTEFLDAYTASQVRSGRTPHMTPKHWVAYNRRILINMGFPPSMLSQRLCQTLTKAMANAGKHYQLVTGARRTLRLLTERFKLGLISNTSHDLRGYLRDDRIIQYFDAVVLSYEVGYWKPDTRIFLYCCDIVGVSPERAAYVGDLLICDHHGASQAGLVPVLKRQWDWPYEPEGTPGKILTIRGVCELSAALEEQDG